MKDFIMLLGHLSEFLIWFFKKGECYLWINENSIICPGIFFYPKGRDTDTAFYANLLFPVKIIQSKTDFKEYLAEVES